MSRSGRARFVRRREEPCVFLFVEIALSVLESKTLFEEIMTPHVPFVWEIFYVYVFELDEHMLHT